MSVEQNLYKLNHNREEGGYRMKTVEATMNVPELARSFGISIPSQSPRSSSVWYSRDTEDALRQQCMGAFFCGEKSMAVVK